MSFWSNSSDLRKSLKRSGSAHSLRGFSHITDIQSIIRSRKVPFRRGSEASTPYDGTQLGRSDALLASSVKPSVLLQLSQSKRRSEKMAVGGPQDMILT